MQLLSDQAGEASRGGTQQLTGVNEHGSRLALSLFSGLKQTTSWSTADNTFTLTKPFLSQLWSLSDSYRCWKFWPELLMVTELWLLLPVQRNCDKPCPLCVCVCVCVFSLLLTLHLCCVIRKSGLMSASVLYPWPCGRVSLVCGLLLLASSPLLTAGMTSDPTCPPLTPLCSLAYTASLPNVH